VDPDKAVESLEDATFEALVEKDIAEGVARGVARTPTAFVNGEPFVEAFSFEEISKAIDAALKEAGY
jgi:protein-disulfide isomerase